MSRTDSRRHVPLGREGSSARFGLSLAALVIASAACGTEGGPPSATVRDSAGVEIVEYSAGSQRGLARWSAGTASVLDIGDEANGAEQVFAGMGFPRRLSNGEILIAEPFTNELRIFDPAGRFLRKFGHGGDGPGEFRGIASVVVDDLDSIFVSDGRSGYVAVFARDGTLARELSLPQNESVSFPYLPGRFQDGSFLVRGTVRTRPREGRFRTQGALSIMKEGDGSMADVGTFPAADFFSTVLGEGAGGYGRIPFSRDFHVVVAGRLSHLSSAGAYELHGYDSSGVLRRIVRLDAPPREVTEEDIAEYERRRAERARPMPGPPLPDPPYPDVFPALAGIVADRLGNLWVRDCVPNPAEADSAVWTIFTNDGRMLAGATLPGAWRIGEIGPDYLLVIEADDFDVAHLKMYELRKGGD